MGPDIIYVIRHGEKPADPPVTPPPFGIDSRGAGRQFAAPARVAAFGCAHWSLRSGDGLAASRTADSGRLALAVPRQSQQDDGAPYLPVLSGDTNTVILA
jgi:hypothetical protein